MTLVILMMMTLINSLSNQKKMSLFKKFMSKSKLRSKKEIKKTIMSLQVKFNGIKIIKILLHFKDFLLHIIVVRNKILQIFKISKILKPSIMDNPKFNKKLKWIHGLLQETEIMIIVFNYR